MKAILLYATTDRIAQLSGWCMGLLTAGLILRLITDLLTAFTDIDPETSFRETLRKSKKRLLAVLIALTVDSLIAFLRHFY